MASEQANILARSLGYVDFAELEADSANSKRFQRWIAKNTTPTMLREAATEAEADANLRQGMVATAARCLREQADQLESGTMDVAEVQDELRAQGLALSLFSSKCRKIAFAMARADVAFSI